jgi:hypothetical protein
LSESDEANNLHVGPTISVSGGSVDLVPIAVTASMAGARWYETVTISWTVENRGENPIPRGEARRDGVHLSTDARSGVDVPFHTSAGERVRMAVASVAASPAGLPRRHRVTPLLPNRRQALVDQAEHLHGIADGGTSRIIG